MEKRFWYPIQFEVVSTSNIFWKRRRCMAERLGKISSNVREMLIKMLSNIKKASVELFISEDGVIKNKTNYNINWLANKLDIFARGLHARVSLLLSLGNHVDNLKT